MIFNPRVASNHHGTKSIIHSAINSMFKKFSNYGINMVLNAYRFLLLDDYYII
jgi:hypothetical protein